MPHPGRDESWSLDNELSHPTSVQCCHPEPFTALRVNAAKGLSRWVERCFPFATLRASAHSLSMTGPTLNGKIHNRAPTNGVNGPARLSVAGFGTGNECADNGDHSDHEEQRGVF